MTRPLIAAALFAFLAVSPALGADDDLKQLPIFYGDLVFYGDLDLHSAAGQTELRVRLTQAASKLCHPRWMAQNPDSELGARLRQSIYRACLGRVSNRAMAKIDDQTGAVARN